MRMPEEVTHSQSLQSDPNCEGKRYASSPEHTVLTTTYNSASRCQGDIVPNALPLRHPACTCGLAHLPVKDETQA